MSPTAGYQPPGVYVSQQSSGTITGTSASTPNTVALVGPTLGYFTNTDTLVLSSASTTALSQKGINASTISVTNSGGTVYALTTDYLVTVTGTGVNSVTSVELSTGSSITSTTTVFISYQFTDSTYFLPRRFSSLNAIQAAYGVGYSAANTLVSPITFAAQCLYANGSPQVVVQPTSDVGAVATRTGLSSAYANLATLQDVYFIVPVAAGISGIQGTPGDVINVASDLAAFIGGLVPYNQFAMGLYAPESTSSVLASSISSAVSNQRIVTFYPNNLLAFNSASGQNINVGGYNLAAACAGFLASNAPQQGLTSQPISGFAGIPTSVGVLMNQSLKNSLESSGVSVLVPNISNQTYNILQGVTTNMSSPNTSEISVVRSIDDLIFSLTTALVNSQLVGSATTTDTAGLIQSVAQGILEDAVSSGQILAYTGLSATLSVSAPTTASVTFSVAPAYPLNYIDVLYTINANGVATTATS